VSVAALDEDAGLRAGALVPLDDAHLVVAQRHVAQLRIGLLEAEAQRLVEGPDRAGRLGDRVDGLAADLHPDGGLGPDVGAVALDDHAVALDLEELLPVAEHSGDEELEGRVGRLVLVAAELALLQLLDEPLHLRALLVQLDAEFPGLEGEAAAPGHVGDEHPGPVADQGRVDVLVAARDLLGGVRVEAALVGERGLADEGRLGVGPEVGQLVKEEREVPQLGQVRAAAHRPPHLEREVGQMVTRFALPTRSP
jgi:hypothetical protein